MAEKIGDVVKRLMPELREYQHRMVRATLLSFMNHPEKTPCIVAPTGSGKSWVIAGLCKVIMEQFPDSRSLVLAHRKELVEQNSDKFNQVHSNIPFGLYSAGLKKRDIRSVTFAGIQSVYKRAAEFGKIDLTIIDEAHLISTRNMGIYRRLLRELKEINPQMFIVGLTATPYRTGAGYITDDNGGERLFDPPLIETVTIPELIEGGYLAQLVSRLPNIILNVEGVKVQNGDYVGSQLDEAVNNAVNNAKIAAEINARGKDRRSWLVFAAGIKHAHALYNELRDLRIDCAVLTGKTPSDERREIISDFKNDRLRALINVNVLTTGFDYPNIDLIAGCRPTLSPVLYTQMAGRGMRIKDADRFQDCLYLDFANNIKHFGPITDMKIEKGNTEPAKDCPNCHQLNPESNKKCSICGYEFPEPTKECPKCKEQVPKSERFCQRCGHDFAPKKTCPWCGAEVLEAEPFCPHCDYNFVAHEEHNEQGVGPKLKNNGHIYDILGARTRKEKPPAQKIIVDRWEWSVYPERDNAEKMGLNVRYYPAGFGYVVKEYFSLNHNKPFVHQKAVQGINQILRKKALNNLYFSLNESSFSGDSMQLAAEKLNEQAPPKKVIYQRCIGKAWDTILGREW